MKRNKDSVKVDDVREREMRGHYFSFFKYRQLSLARIRMSYEFYVRIPDVT